MYEDNDTMFEIAIASKSQQEWKKKCHQLTLRQKKKKKSNIYIPFLQIA